MSGRSEPMFTSIDHGIHARPVREMIFQVCPWRLTVRTNVKRHHESRDVQRLRSSSFARYCT
eukprot:6363060-Prymnesium_polylepis.1